MIWFFYIIRSFLILIDKIGILLPKLFWPTVRKNCSSHREKLLKLKAENLQILEITRTIYLNMKGQNNFWQKNACSWKFLISNKLEQLEFK